MVEKADATSVFSCSSATTPKCSNFPASGCADFRRRSGWGPTNEEVAGAEIVRDTSAVLRHIRVTIGAGFSVVVVAVACGPAEQARTKQPPASFASTPGDAPPGAAATITAVPPAPPATEASSPSAASASPNSGNYTPYQPSGDPSGCLGACGNGKMALEGWCGNCKDHCAGGTEKECTGGCKEKCEQAKRDNNCDEKCEQAKRDNDWPKKCEAAGKKRGEDCKKAKDSGNQGAIGSCCSESGDCYKGNTAAIGHWCSTSGDGRKGAAAAIGHWCSDDGAGRKGCKAAVADACPDGNSWNGCLAACGGQKDCRAMWCDDKGSERRKCYGDAKQAFEACEKKCRDGKDKCVNPRCAGPFLLGDCDGKTKIDGFCIGGTVRF
jgi:hypothetical protein